ncbi:hypothetical protein BDQ94DRAFT_132777 [Aspergillus welwitschiae]|uniref:Transmembrane protein n=3 Tax=Aspergillus TaxID=5052 RepID=A0A3F3QJ20_9EURO|nr:uncharacterized protein BO96DRAFT_262994 [Aspergillus niger CBS 101883]XP_026632290.1 hypothetical protein BDQ94DRAFT_132777 [Aspergillus welwitschiae]RDH23854.1 hypothetical protein M747DRAFT_134053 [Aspergillus niger ATCC 13496]RDK45250.1 hypothetical protein M752DRAFT_134808 [Aspergillus phoenicis ATCC 13157]PYH57667.1 hypothetical protein BO96DRAFT_262994 [Aspergillus niger CBS 101883]RDH39268.1 hypothetical protein BDQ94DRAFT_132777 [Aspergillus welwitschiae]
MHAFLDPMHCTSLSFRSSDPHGPLCFYSFFFTYPYKFLFAVKVDPKGGYDYDTAQAQSVMGFTICLSCHHQLPFSLSLILVIFLIILSIHVQIFGSAVMTRVDTFPFSSE